MLGRGALAVLFLGATACRQAGVRPDVFSSEAVVLEVPIVEQEELNECGLAAVTALCRFHGVEMPGEERATLARLAREREGLSGEELERALERSGLEVYVFEGTLDRSATGVYGHIERGRPLLAMISRDGEANHYVLVVGYDPALGNLIVFDPRRGRILLPVTSFERLWSQAGRFTLLAVPIGPATSEETGT